jgi:hypothetical protein
MMGGAGVAYLIFVLSDLLDDRFEGPAAPVAVADMHPIRLKI